MGQTEGLPLYEGGSITIELDANLIGYVAGDQICGKVHLNLEKSLKCTYFTIGLQGYDVGSYMDK
jgi:hypothetical protein